MPLSPACTKGVEGVIKTIFRAKTLSCGAKLYRLHVLHHLQSKVHSGLRILDLAAHRFHWSVARKGLATALSKKGRHYFNLVIDTDAV